MREWWLRHYWRWYMRPVFKLVSAWKRRYRPAGHAKNYWTYSRPGHQWGPWADRTLISPRWRQFATSADPEGADE